MKRVISVVGTGPEPSDKITLESGDRHLRRKVLTLRSGEAVLVDLPEPVVLLDGHRLVLEDSRHVEVVAPVEELMEVTIADPRDLIGLAWQIGNRHLPAQIEADRILVQQDHVIRDMLVGLGATIRDVSAPFTPERGAYRGGHHGHQHNHGHHSHDHD